MLNLISNFWKVIIRTSAFILKEIVIIGRQPQLLLTLVLGPFLIILIFGMGVRTDPPTLRTLFVAQPGSELHKQIETNAPTLGRELIFMGITGDLASALKDLQNGRVDLVAVAPENAFESVQANLKAEFELYHREIDPLLVDYVGYFGEIYISEVNRRVLQSITAEGQAEAENIRQELEAARNNKSAVLEALRSGDEAAAHGHMALLANNLEQVSGAAGIGLAVLSSVEGALSGEDHHSEGEIAKLLDVVHQLNDEMQRGADEDSNKAAWEDQLEELGTGLDDLETQLGTFTRLDAGLIISPFSSKTINIAKVRTDEAGYYAPAVIALLVQHLAVTIAALSTVQERNFGTLELFRVSPLAAGEVLVGKYLSYMLFGTVVAATLVGLLHFVLKVPMLGLWANYALVIGGLLFTSLGVGFVISLISRTDSQAVQYTMIVLLTSVFFSGLLLSLDQLREPVRVISWSIPTTYGIVLLREIALRGNIPAPQLVAGLAAIGLGLFLVAWVLLHRIIASTT